MRTIAREFGQRSRVVAIGAAVFSPSGAMQLHAGWAHFLFLPLLLPFKLACTSRARKDGNPQAIWEYDVGQN
jgi:hypothetical protein